MLEVARGGKRVADLSFGNRGSISTECFERACGKGGATKFTERVFIESLSGVCMRTCVGVGFLCPITTPTKDCHDVENVCTYTSNETDVHPKNWHTYRIHTHNREDVRFLTASIPGTRRKAPHHWQEWWGCEDGGGPRPRGIPWDLWESEEQPSVHASANTRVLWKMRMRTRMFEKVTTVSMSLKVTTVSMSF